MALETPEQERAALEAAFSVAERGGSPEEIERASLAGAPQNAQNAPAGGVGPGQPPPPKPANAPGQGSAGHPEPARQAAQKSGGPIPGVPRPGQSGYQDTEKTAEEEGEVEEPGAGGPAGGRGNEIDMERVRQFVASADERLRNSEVAMAQAKAHADRMEQMVRWAAQNPEAFGEWVASGGLVGGGGIAGDPMRQAPPVAGQAADPDEIYRRVMSGVEKALDERFTNHGVSSVRGSAEYFTKSAVARDPVFNGREEDVELFIANKLRQDALSGKIKPTTQAWEIEARVNQIASKKAKSDKKLFESYSSHQAAQHRDAVSPLTPPVGALAGTHVPRQPASRQEEDKFYSTASDSDFNRMVLDQWEEFDRAISGLVV